MQLAYAKWSSARMEPRRKWQSSRSTILLDLNCVPLPRKHFIVWCSILLSRNELRMNHTHQVVSIIVRLLRRQSNDIYSEHPVPLMGWEHLFCHPSMVDAVTQRPHLRMTHQLYKLHKRTRTLSLATTQVPSVGNDNGPWLKCHCP